MIREIKIDLTYQPIIPDAPVQDLYQRACSGDGATINHWRETWIRNYKATKDRFGTFAEKNIGQLYGENRGKAALVIGSGPSLKSSLKALKDNQESPFPVFSVSCLHNKGLFDDEGIEPNYYLTLDAGEIVLKDVVESRKESEDFYWEKSKGQKLLAHVCTDPKLFEKWQGEVYLFNTVVPDASIMEEYAKIERFAHYLSCGGNALGACMYAARMLFASPTILYVGADFCFSWDNVWHSYETKTYDNLGHYVLHPDIFGIPRKTWQSYLNFKFWFDHIAKTVPGNWVNCSEGLMGAYQGGNIRHFKYQTLDEAIIENRMSDRVFIQAIENGKEVSKKPFDMAEMWKDPHHAMDLIAF